MFSRSSPSSPRRTLTAPPLSHREVIELLGNEEQLQQHLAHGGAHNALMHGVFAIDDPARAIRRLCRAAGGRLDWDAKDANGFAPLHKAHTICVVRELLDAGADVGVQDKYGHTPLSHAETAEVALELIVARGAGQRDGDHMLLDELQPFIDESRRRYEAQARRSRDPEPLRAEDTRLSRKLEAVLQRNRSQWSQRAKDAHELLYQ